MTVQAGETVAVVGPSGSGKSTLLGCLAGLDEPAGGVVWVGGERLSHRSESERAQIRANRIGVLMQTNNLLGHLDLSANLRIAQLARRPGRGDRRVLPATGLLEAVGLGARRHAYPPELSGGELARAGLATALANDPDVLLADEPTGELDDETEQQILALLRDRATAGSGLVIVTHSDAVAHAADRVVRLSDGQVQA